MSAERVQFTIAAGEELFGWLSGIEHPAWPRIAKAAAWSRAALRVLYAHHARGADVEWVHVRGRRTSKPFEPRAPDGLNNIKVDVLLSENDRQRLALLERAEVAGSAAAIMRLAVHFLAQVGAQLEKGGELMLATQGSVTSRVDLSAIALDEAAPVDSGSFRLTVPRSSAPRDAQMVAETHASKDIDAFFSVIWLVGTYNRWLVRYVDLVSWAAVRAKEEWRRLAPEDVVQQRHQSSQEWEEKLDLSRLFEVFLSEEKAALRQSRRSCLARVLPEHRLFPKQWRDAAVSQGRGIWLAKVGVKAVRAYLKGRSDELRPWLPGSSAATGSVAPLKLARPKEGLAAAPWRGWTRSRPTDAYREVNAALEWTSVMHHWLSSRRGGTAALAAHDLQTLLVDAFGARNSLHTGPLAESCSKFNEAFYDRAVLSGRRALEESDRMLTIDELLTELSVPIRADTAELPLAQKQEEERNFACLVYLALNVARVAQPVYRWKVEREGDPEAPYQPVRFGAVAVGVRSRAYADVAELQARIFGAQTTLEGLHWILRGGIVPRANRGRVWLVTGEPGSGKSTCGLSIAADMARRGRVSVLVCSDQQAATVHERLGTFAMHDPLRYAIVDYDDLQGELADDSAAIHAESAPRAGASAVKGLLVIVGAARQRAAAAALGDDVSEQLKLSTWLREISQLSRAICETFTGAEKATGDEERKAWLRALWRKWRWISVVIDSIDTLEAEVPSFARQGHADDNSQRVLITKLVQEVEASRIWAILLCGKHNALRLPLTYLADTVIELGSDNARLRRTLQIVKCRTQAYDPGEHTMQIVERAGVVLHPNLASIQRAARRRTMRPIDRKHVVPIPRQLLWQDSAAQARELPLLVEQQLPVDLFSIRRGSTILCYGPPQSGKMPFLLNLVSERAVLSKYPMWRLGATGAVLLVSFRANPQECLRPLHESQLLATKWSGNISDIQLQWYGVDDTLCPEQVAHELIRRIQRSRRDGVPIEWIVFLGVDAIQNNLPLVYADRSFWPTILAVTASEEITTAFALVDPADRFIAQHKLDMDYILRFTPAVNGGPRTIAIEKSADMPAPNGYPTIMLDLHGGTVTVATQTS
jgi:KaiC/GvpD/RAD55 family RecA-like ATPase